jgi:hypothetical protein
MRNLAPRIKQIFSEILRDKAAAVYAICAAILGMSCGLFIFPSLYSSLQYGFALSISLSIAEAVACIAAIVILFSRLFSSKTGLPMKHTVKNAFTACGILLAAVLVVSVIFGVIAVLVNAAFKTRLNIEQIKTIVDVITAVIAVALVPAAIHVFFSAGMSAENAIRGLVQSLGTLRGHYLQNLIIAAILFAVSLLLGLPGGTFGSILRVALLPILGAAGILTYLALYVPREK